MPPKCTPTDGGRRKLEPKKFNSSEQVASLIDSNYRSKAVNLSEERKEKDSHILSPESILRKQVERNLSNSVKSEYSNDFVDSENAGCVMHLM